MAVYAKTVQSPESKDSYIFQPLSNIHYDAQAGNFSNKIISHQLLNVLWLIAAFILAIACVNFINLSTAQAVNRSKEVGVRKVLGSNQFQIQLQFIVETFLIVIGAVVLAIVFSLVAWHYVNRLLELSVPFSVFGSSTIILFLSVITVAVTVLAGFYPSIFLSRFNAVTALRLKIADGNSKGISLRRGLVIFQFIIAQGLIIGTIIIARQMDYFMDQPLGFDKSAIVNVPFRVDSVRMSKMNQLLSISGVQAVSFSSNTPIEDADNSWNTLKFDHASKDANFKAILKFADDQYVPAYKLPLIAGRNLKASEMTREFLVNESLMKSLGINNPDEILNKDISIWGDVITCPVVGVLKDFNNRSFRDKPAPLLITTNKTMYNQASIKLATTNITSTMKAVKNLWEQTFPDFVFEYKFLDEKIDRFYKQENQMSQLYKIFAAIAIFLSCLGLYGLASFMAVQRVKEVGIRKVLGASAAHIVYLFSREFILLIAIAFAIATPIAWYYMHTWLQGYAYRISISWWIFVAGGLAAVFIALATISFQAIKAARANPVKSLRSE
jgi:ABC-type antimicrobial peptide transport system permease subunit